MELSGLLHAPAEQSPRYSWTEGWTSPGACLESVENEYISSLCQESKSESSVVQRVASHYTH
jgi:hypothetical protein